MRRPLACVAALGLLAGVSEAAWGEDGYDLWLRYAPLPSAAASAMASHAGTVVAAGRSPTVRAAVAELQRGFGRMTGRSVGEGSAPAAGSIVLALGVQARPLGIVPRALAGLGSEGFLIRTVGQATVIAANDEAGLLYGAFRLLELAEQGQPLDSLDVRSAPKLELRMLDHWDNLDGTVERGYAGHSIWDWWHLPDWKGPRYTDYARANASVGINGTVLNNVNASAESLTPRYIAKAAALADMFRPYHLKVYLSAKFTAPMELGGLKTADPKDPAVQAWWRAKADEIYRAIPDFGGFLVKANSEAQPGPQDYGRTHADGANLLARAVARHGGVILYRAFVYDQNNREDRAKQAYADFKPLDGRFDPNVVVQVKNGPIDFQPREPFHPLFGAMPRTPLMIEFQVTKEYLGFATHLVYLGPLFQEVLDSDTGARKRDATVADVIEGKVTRQRLTGMAGVANIGDDRNWTGSPFNGANWYAYGRFAWDPEGSAEAYAREWAAMTFTPDPKFVRPAVTMMMGSREAAVDYMTPLGLAHQMATGSHYGPGPWVSDLARPEWNPTYYAKADRTGIGFDRTATGSDAVAQYNPSVAAAFADVKRVPERDLLWFHHVAWDYRLSSGQTAWEALAAHYDMGVADVAGMERTWAGLAPFVDPERFDQTAAYLRVQAREARWWRDASLAYWQSVNGLPLPAGVAPPEHDLGWYKAQRFPFAPGHPGG
jgi:alpha-glucuronidase